MSLINSLNIGLYNQVHPAEINDVIKELLSYYDRQHKISEFDEISGFEAAGRSIRGLFGQYCHCNNGIVITALYCRLCNQMKNYLLLLILIRV